MSKEVIRVGILGVGMIGVQHLTRLREKFPGVEVQGVFDAYTPLAEEVARKHQVKAFASARELIEADDIDALLVCSADSTHAEYLQLCLAVGKPAFCEKPLSDSAEAAKKLVEEEMAGGKRLISVGYMRRFDRAYMQMKAQIDSGRFGETLLIHCRHRNADPPNFSTAETNILNSMVHEFDILRWLTGEDYVRVKAYLPKKSSLVDEKMHDPQFVVLESASGVIMDIESFLGAGYGYDVQCELVAEKGTIELPSTYSTVTRKALFCGEDLHPEWNSRFAEAYDRELAEWVSSLREKRISTLAHAWDGYVVTLTAAIANESRLQGRELAIELPPTPAFYKEDQA